MRTAVLLSTTLLAATSAAFALQARAARAGAPLPIVSDAAAAPAPAPRPLRVALQAGHWKAAEAPDEQARLRTNGTRGGGKAEWEVNLSIARRAGALLERAGYEVEILPTTIPPGYRADLFVSIHADGSPSPRTSGYRVAAPRRDQTGRAAEFATVLQRTYGEATGIRLYPTLTRRMQNYYAFNSRRYRHALHPSTVAVIIETGFLTSPTDRRVIVDAQDLSARGIADAVHLYLGTTPLRPPAVSGPRAPAIAR